MRTPVPVLARRSAGAVATLLLLVGCSSSGGSRYPTAHQVALPAVARFQPGACRLHAPEVLAVGREANGLGTGAPPAQDARDRLEQNQQALGNASAGFDLATRPAVDRLVVEIGLVRLRADSHSYTPDLAQALAKAYQEVVTPCTAPRGSGTATPTP